MKNFLFILFSGVLTCVLFLAMPSCHAGGSSDDDEITENPTQCRYKVRQANITIGNKTLVEGDSFCIDCTEKLSISFGVYPLNASTKINSNPLTNLLSEYA